MNCALVNKQTSTATKLGRGIVNILCQLFVKYYVVEVFVEFYLSVKLKSHSHFPKCAYTNPFLCLVKRSFLEFVQAFLDTPCRYKLCDNCYHQRGTNKCLLMNYFRINFESEQI